MAFLTRTLAVAAVLALAACSPKPQTPPGVEIAGAWVRATAPGAMTGAGYVTLTNTGSAPDRLIAVASPAAVSVQVHESISKDGVASMKHMPALDLPPGKAVVLKPGGYHIMLMGLAGPLEPSGQALMTLTFEKAGSQTVAFPVQSGAPMADEHHH